MPEQPFRQATWFISRSSSVSLEELLQLVEDFEQAGAKYRLEVACGNSLINEAKAAAELAKTKHKLIQEIRVLWSVAQKG